MLSRFTGFFESHSLHAENKTPTALAWSVHPHTVRPQLMGNKEHNDEYISQRRVFMPFHARRREDNKPSQAIDIDVCRSQKVISILVTFLISQCAAFIATESCSDSSQDSKKEAVASDAAAAVGSYDTLQQGRIYVVIGTKPNDCLFVCFSSPNRFRLLLFSIYLTLDIPIECIAILIRVNICFVSAYHVWDAVSLVVPFPSHPTFNIEINK